MRKCALYLTTFASLTVGNWPRKLWFYMPLMHSENLKDHDLFRAKVAYWMSHPVTAEHEEERKVIQINFKFEEDHRTFQQGL